MGSEGYKPLAFYSRIDDSDKKRYRENVDALDAGTWLTPEVVGSGASRKIELTDQHGDPVGLLMAGSVESIAPRLDLMWTVRILSHQRYYLRDDDGDEDPDKVSYTLLVFTYPAEQEAHMAPQLKQVEELVRTGQTVQMNSTRQSGLLNLELSVEQRPNNLTQGASGCAGTMLMLLLAAIAVLGSLGLQAL